MIIGEYLQSQALSLRFPKSNVRLSNVIYHLYGDVPVAGHLG